MLCLINNQAGHGSLPKREFHFRVSLERPGTGVLSTMIRPELPPASVGTTVQVMAAWSVPA